MTVLCDENISSKEIGKKSKYKDLEVEIQRVRKIKTEIIAMGI